MTTDYDHDILDNFLAPTRRQRPFLASLTERQERIIATPEAKLPLHKTNPAEHLRRTLGAFIQRFERGLDAGHEVGISMTDAAILSPLWLVNIVTCGPEHLELIGVNAAGERIHIMRHYTQPAIALTAVKKQDAEQEPRRIGFLFGDQGR